MDMKVQAEKQQREGGR